MKVNTDGILLGASVNIQHCENIFDLGTGSGLIAIMLAQRTPKNCTITALELEQNAFQQAVENAKNSTWSERITVLQGDVMQQHFTQKFDLIVSNPPYFSDSLPSKNAQRDLARAVRTQTHLDWLQQAKKWLKENGRVTMILSTEAAEKLISQSHQMGLYCIEKWLIFTKLGKKPKRMIVSFGSQQKICELKELVIYTADNQYTDEFKTLTQAFYYNL